MPSAVLCVAAKEVVSHGKTKGQRGGQPPQAEGWLLGGPVHRRSRPGDGESHLQERLGKTQAEAKTKLKAAIEEAKGLDVTRTGKYTVGEWMEVWFEHYAKVKVRPSSHQTCRGYIDNHIKPNIGKIPYGSRFGSDENGKNNSTEKVAKKRKPVRII